MAPRVDALLPKIAQHGTCPATVVVAVHKCSAAQPLRMFADLHDAADKTLKQQSQP